jgi:hypothetical protein
LKTLIPARVAEGKIEDDELDPRLLADIDLVDPDARIKREEVVVRGWDLNPHHCGDITQFPFFSQ